MSKLPEDFRGEGVNGSLRHFRVKLINLEIINGRIKVVKALCEDERWTTLTSLKEEVTCPQCKQLLQ